MAAEVGINLAMKNCFSNNEAAAWFLSNYYGSKKGGNILNTDII